MFGSTVLTTLLGAPPLATAETPIIKSYVRLLARQAGLHVLLTQPGTKMPADMRTKKEREADLEAGKKAGVYLATDDTRTLDKYIGRYRKDAPARPSKVNPAGYGAGCAVGLAIHLGPSRLVVIDADTPSEVAALKEYWMSAEGLDDPRQVPHMTVATPGQTNDQGQRIHSEGGHWYFTLPEGFDINPVTTPSAIAVTVDGVGQFTVKTGSSYVLIPPTEREGRAYTMLAPDNEAPLWLLQLIKQRENLAAADPQGARDERDQAARERAALVARLSGATLATPVVSAEVPENWHNANPSLGEVSSTPVETITSIQTTPVKLPDMSGVWDIRSRILGQSPAAPAAPVVDDEVTAQDIMDEVLEERETQLDGDTLDEQLENWSSMTSWDEIMEPDGWELSGRQDSCGCQIWTRPDFGDGMGPPSTTKSATAHDAGCNRERTDHGHPAMHIWTEHPGDKLQALIDAAGTRTVSKFSVYAALAHEGNMGAAMEHAGVTAPAMGGGLPMGMAAVMGMAGLGEQQSLADQMSSQDNHVPSVAPADDQWETPPVPTPSPVPSAEQAHPVPSVEQDDDGFTLPYMDLFPEDMVTTPSGRDVFAEWGIARPDAPGPDGSVSDEWRKQVPSFGSFAKFRDMPPVGWVIDGMLERGGLLSLIGPSGVGKSAVVLDMACTIAAGVGHWHQRKCDSHPVIYVAGEGVSGAVERVKAWERANDMVGALDDRLYIVPESVNLAASQMTWAYVAHLARGLGAGLIILDTFARMSGGLEENSSKDMGAAVTRMDKVRRTSGAAVMVVHHTGRGSTHSRGSTAINGAMDSEVLLTLATPKTQDEDAPMFDDHGDLIDGKALTLSVSKQKNGPDDIALELVLADEKDVKAVRSYSGPKPGMVVTDVNGRPSRYSSDYLQGEAPRSFAPPKPEAVEETAKRVMEFVQDFKTLEVSRTAIKDGVRPDYYHADKLKAWGTHMYRVLDLLVTKGQLARDGRSSYRIPTDDERVIAQPAGDMVH